jgi:hypothetical protein
MSNSEPSASVLQRIPRMCGLYKFHSFEGTNVRSGDTTQGSPRFTLSRSDKLRAKIALKPEHQLVQLIASLTGLPTRLSISTSASIVNLAVFLFTTSDNLFARRSLETFGLVRRKTQFQEEVRPRFCHMADFGVDLHFFSFLARTTAR